MTRRAAGWYAWYGGPKEKAAGFRRRLLTRASSTGVAYVRKRTDPSSARQGENLTPMGTTRVYIDGFNLYHGLIHESRTHWLDLSAFAKRLNRNIDVDRVIYCTARVSGTGSESGKPDRQDRYLRALAAACPNVEIVYGNFRTNSKPYPLAACRNDPTCAIWVSVRTEKGSDVNLAARLLHDAHLKRFDRAIVISGDSDLVEPIRLVTKELGKTVWVRNPRNKDSVELEGVATHYDRIRPSVALAAQLPDPVIDGDRRYSKPPEWGRPAPVTAKNIVNAWTCAQGNCGKCFKCFRYE